MVSFLDVALGVGQIAGGFLANKAAGKAADAQVAGSQAAIDEQRRQFDLTRADLAPFREAGVNGLNRFVAALGPSFQESDAFKFNLDQGIRAIDRSAAARGKALSGEAVRGGINFASGLASNEFGNYLNRLGALSGVGQSATNTGAQAGANTAGNIGNALINAGDARASGFVGGANAINDSLNNLMLFGALRQ